jgi:hypothetical protein
MEAPYYIACLIPFTRRLNSRKSAGKWYQAGDFMHLIHILDILPTTVSSIANRY